MSDPALAGPRVPAVRNAVAVLRKLAGSAQPVPAAAIVRTLGIPRSSAYQLLQVLVEEGLVAHVPESRGYVLGVGTFELGTAYLRHQPLENLARPLLRRLSGNLGETAQLGVLHGREMLYLLKEEPKRRTALVTDIGVRLPAHLTASGRSILATLPISQLVALFPRPEVFVDRTGVGAHSLRELRTVLREDAARGWSIERDSVTEGITCVAAAAFDRTGMAAASVVVSFRTERYGTVPENVTRHVLATARELSRRLGADLPEVAGDVTSFGH
jgi:DNA-binding IclR family transcriptional regulator